jgi:hypothetical protein
VLLPHELVEVARAHAVGQRATALLRELTQRLIEETHGSKGTTARFGFKVKTLQAYASSAVRVRDGSS